MIPLLTLGIPSSPTIAILMGAFIINGLSPGPFLFAEKPELVWAVIASFFLGNVILLVLNLPLVGLWARLLRIPYQYICVGTLVFCVIGAYSLRQNVFDVGVMLVFGVIGYLMRKIDLPMAPLILGLILGKEIERSLRTSLEMSGGDFSIFFTRPLCLSLLAVAFIALVVSAFNMAPREVRKPAGSATLTWNRAEVRTKKFAQMPQGWAVCPKNSENRNISTVRRKLSCSIVVKSSVSASELRPLRSPCHLSPRPIRIGPST